MLKRFFEQLSKEMGLAKPLVSNEEGSYSLFLESDLEISLRENAESGITLFTVVAPLPAGKNEEYMLMLMTANLLGRETGGCALGLDKAGKNVTLTTFLSEELNYKQFHEALESFANYTDSWREETTEFIQGATA
ncbi:MAG: hypothetical protein KR126chlam2_01217 [Chlamydiae bacterium]|nr:hypothetical protein [Chlamydiota bacterium]